jgi:hypothetical protein
MEEEKQMVDSLRSALKAVIDFDVDTLARRDMGDYANFVQGVPIFQRVQELFQVLDECELDFIPLQVLQELHTIAQNVKKKFEAILNIDPKSGNPAQNRDSIFQGFYDSYAAEWYPRLSAAIAFAREKGTDYNRLEREAKGVVAEQGKILEEMKSQTHEKLSEMEEALKQVRSAAAEAGVSQQAIYFNSAARRHFWTSLVWLVATIALGAYTLAFALTELLPPPASTVTRQPDEAAVPPVAVPTSVVIQRTIGRVIVISLLTTLLLWCARNYSANHHNFVVNRHRQNCMSSFNAFVKASGGDPATKNAVLLQATQAIFAPQTTSFSHKEAGTAQGSQIVEIVRTVNALTGKQPDAS